VATTFQLLEDYTQGYEQRIRAHGNQASPGDLRLIDRPLFQPPAPQADQLLGPQAGTLIARLTVMRIFPPTSPNTEPVLLYAGNADHNLVAGVISGQGSFRSDDASAVFSIIGGTGTYELAQGTITLDFLPSNTGRFTYRLLP
jgi:hypothetical protein